MAKVQLQSGDTGTVAQLALRFGVSASDILRANPNLKSTSQSVAGLNLEIPDAAPAPTTANPKPPKQTAAPAPTVTQPKPVAQPKVAPQSPAPVQAAPVAAPSIATPSQATNGNNSVYKDDLGNVFEVGTNRHISLNEFQQKGYNIDHINTKQNLVQPKGPNSVGTVPDGSQYGTQPVMPSVADILSGLGLAFPEATTGDDTTKAQLQSQADLKELNDFQDSLRRELLKIENNPFLLGSEAIGQKRRVAADNQATLQALIDKAGASRQAYADAVAATERNEDRRLQLTGVALDVIQRQADNVQRAWEQSRQTKEDNRAYELNIAQLRNATPQGQSFQVGGVTYEGLKAPPKSTVRTEPDPAKTILTALQRTQLAAKGVPEDVTSFITQSIFAGGELDEIRAYLGSRNVDPQLLDIYDSVVNIEGLRERANNTGFEVEEDEDDLTDFGDTGVTVPAGGNFA